MLPMPRSRLYAAVVVNGGLCRHTRLSTGGHSRRGWRVAYNDRERGGPLRPGGRHQRAATTRANQRPGGGSGRDPAAARCLRARRSACPHDGRAGAARLQILYAALSAQCAVGRGRKCRALSRQERGYGGAGGGAAGGGGGGGGGGRGGGRARAAGGGGRAPAGRPPRRRGGGRRGGGGGGAPRRAAARARGG